jgi:replicative DNA helicase
MKRGLLPIEAKLPPQAIELEEVVLGAIMLEQDVFQKVSDILNEGAFYKEPNRLIYKAICDLKKENKPIDILTVTNQLKKSGDLDTCGGAYAITMLTTNVSSSAKVEAYARIMMEKYLLRELINLSQIKMSQSYLDDADPFELIDDLKASLQVLIDSTGIEESNDSFSKILDDEFEKKKKSIEAGAKMTGIPTGNPDLDKIIQGFEEGNLVILGGRPGMGKSTRMLLFAKEVARQDPNHISVIFSLEMTKYELVRKYIIESSDIYMNKYRNNELNPVDITQIEYAISRLKSLNIHIFDTPAIQPKYIRKRLRDIKKRNPNKKIAFVGVDYLQLMRADEKINNREQEIGSISRELKAIAKDENTTVMPLAQLSREVEKDGGDKRPKLSHLRESGAIEQDADVVMFVYRPSYYFDWGQHPDNKYSQESCEEAQFNMASELIIAKNRNGESSIIVDELFIGSVSRFTPKRNFVPNNQDITQFASEDIEDAPPF